MKLLCVIISLTTAVFGGEPASFNCFRTGQDCANAGTCNDGVCQCGVNSLFDCSITATVNEAPCDVNSCGATGLCVGDGTTTATCHCNAGWDLDADGKCTVPRYKVYCGHDSMIVNVNPQGTFQGVIYEYGDKEETCQLTKSFDHNDVVAAVTALPKQSSNPFTGGKAAVIKNDGTIDGTASACSPVSLAPYDDGDDTTKMYSVKRTFIVQYHPDYLIQADEKLVVECRTDLSDQHMEVVMGSISNNPATQEQVNAVTVTDNFGSTLTLVNVDGTESASSGTVGQEKCIRLVNPLMAIHLKKVVFTNNLPESNPKYKTVTVLENSCKASSSGKLGSIWKGVPTTDRNGVVKFCFGLFTIKPTTQLAIKVWANLCPTGVSGCEEVDCSGTQSNGRRKRYTGSESIQYSHLQLTGIDVTVTGEGSTNSQQQDKVTTECDVDNSMTAAVIAMGIIIFLLIIILAVLIIRMMVRRPARKQIPWQQEAYFNHLYATSQPPSVYG